ncbi:palmitoyltransferase, partial [Haematococcus lacustris]
MAELLPVLLQGLRGAWSPDGDDGAWPGAVELVRSGVCHLRPLPLVRQQPAGSGSGPGLLHLYCPGWHPFLDEHQARLELERMQFADYSFDRRDPRRPRWCKRCQCWKPERAHHCSVLGRCVLKMVLPAIPALHLGGGAGGSTVAAQAVDRLLLQPLEWSWQVALVPASAQQGGEARTGGQLPQCTLAADHLVVSHCLTGGPAPAVARGRVYPWMSA